MGKLLQFVRPIDRDLSNAIASARDLTAPLLTPEVTASLEGLVLTPALKERLSGSVHGADEAEVQQRAVAQNPMRLLVRQQCNECRHMWQAPGTGACPKCGGTETTVTGSIPCMALRV